MSVSHHKYSDGIIQHIHQILQTEQENGRPRDYDVHVDDVRVIPRTSVVDLFDTFPQFIKAETNSVSIRLYRATSKHNDKYILYLNNYPFEEGLSGTGVDEQINFRLREQEQEFELQGLRRDNRKLKRKLKKKTRYISKLEDSLLEYKAKPFHLGNVNLGELSSYALEGVVRRNTHWLTGLPGGEALAGAIERDNEQKAKALNSGAASQPEGEASFQRAESTDGFSPEQQVDLATGAEIRKSFGTELLPDVVTILRGLATHPNLIPKVIQFIHKKTNGGNEDAPA